MKAKTLNGALGVLCNLAIFAILCLPALSWSQSTFDSDTRRADTYRRGDAMVEGQVQSCVVLQVRKVKLEVGNTTKLAATTAGGVIGGALASRNTSSGNYAVAAVGSVLGAFAGHTVAQKVGGDDANEILLKCGTAAITVVQEVDDSPVPAKGAEVHLIRQGGRSRVVI